MKSKQKLKVLLVDDTVENLVILSKILSVLDVDIKKAKDGLEAIQMTFHHEFSLIISDVRMPLVDGYRLVKILRESSKFIPIILMSSVLTNEEDLVNGIGQGAIDYICRPFSHKMLLEKVRTFLDLHKKQVTQTLAKEKLLSAKANAGLESKAMFLSTISHEVRTPMNAIIGFSEILLDDHLSKKQVQYLRIIKESGDNLLSIVDDILDISKFETGRISINKNSFNLFSLLESTLEIYQTRAELNDLTLSLEIDPNISEHCLGDASRLRQILVNLLGNSIKFTHSGSIIVKVYQEDNEQIGFQVIDTGIGIEKANIQKIFEAFSQAKNIIMREYSGIGMGLTIVKNIVKLWGGKIDIQSIFNEGTTVSFVLPMEQLTLENIDNKSNSKVIKDKRYQAIKHLNVLCCEDQESNIELLSIFLEDLGYDFTIATNGYDAVNLFRDNEYDLVLMDICMPGMSGLEAIEIIRQFETEHLKTPVPILAVTGNTSPENIECYLSIGFNDYVAKPFKLFKLSAAIDKYCSKTLENE
ncbi:response regulator [bacterium]|nr:response regulator [bacterium]